MRICSKGGDVLSTKACLEQMGVKINRDGDSYVVHGAGKHSLEDPTLILDCGNSGTTMRLLMGLISGENLNATLVGDQSLMSRPMKRISEPLTQMTAQIELSDSDFAPISLSQRETKYLRGIDYELKIASAQLKSALIIAALYADREGSPHRQNSES